MAKKRGTVSLSFVLLRFAVVMLGLLALCFILWSFAMTQMRRAGFILHGSVSNQQVEELLAGDPKTFVSPGDEFLARYALFDQDGKILETNANEKTREELSNYFRQGDGGQQPSRYTCHTYRDGNTVVIRWHYRAEFASPALRRLLPPFEYLWWGTLCMAGILCLLLHTLWLRRYLAGKLRLFGEVSRKIAAKDLDFTVPWAGIAEYDQALEAMEQMRKALYQSLSAQWEAGQEREAEIAALAHDLKTPLTVAGGNAELLLEEELPESSREMAETIEASCRRAREYVAALTDTALGVEEAFESTALALWFDQLFYRGEEYARSRKVTLKQENGLAGRDRLQRERLHRALLNVIINAVQHTGEGGCVYLEGRMENWEELDRGGEGFREKESGEGEKQRNGHSWEVTVRDEGPGFSRAALRHGTERLWREDHSRGDREHSGLGLWFAAQVIRAGGGVLELGNWERGGMVTVRFPGLSRVLEDTGDKNFQTDDNENRAPQDGSLL